MPRPLTPILFQPALHAIPTYTVTYQQHDIEEKQSHRFIGKLPNGVFQDYLNITIQANDSIQIHASSNHTTRLHHAKNGLRNRAIETTYIQGEHNEPDELVLSLQTDLGDPAIEAYLEAINAHIFTGHLTEYMQALAMLTSVRDTPAP